MSEYTLAQAIAVIEGMGACGEALEWLRALPAETTPEEALTQADSVWVVWLAGKLPGCLIFWREYVTKYKATWAEYDAYRAPILIAEIGKLVAGKSQL